MALNTPQDPQLDIINSLEGIHLVDAGAGTGKTYSIVKRYGNIIEKNVEPENILLITYTRNAAEQMKQEVIKKLSRSVSISKLLEAPIMTFHSFCSRILKKSGTTSPYYLGLNEYHSKNFNIIEDSSFEEEIFRKYFLNFSASNKSKYQDILYALEGEHSIVLKVIKKLSSFGIFPTKDGWKNDDIEKITGSFKLFCERFDQQNKKVDGKNVAEKQNKLYKAFNVFLGEKLYLDLNRDKVFLDKSINPEIKEALFHDISRDDYFEFLRDVYVQYIEHLLKRNLLNYEFLVMFAYLILYNDKTVRNNVQFDYVMIDEFQDTDEIQFKLIMLICKNINDRANLCVVGDWKQGIYGFRNTQIENIIEFTRNMQKYKKELNADEIRITFDTGEHKKIIFDTNYRSSDTILKFSRTTLLVKGKDDEEVDVDTIENNFAKTLTPARDLEDLTEIEFYKADNRIGEYQLVLKKISELVNRNEKYKIRVFDKATGEVIEERPVRYSDICVLSRTKRFCRELQREALKSEIPIPVNYGGGLELFASEQGVLVLAWLRLTANEKDLFGWLPVLDKEGYNNPEINFFKENFIDNRPNEYKLFSDFPPELSDFIKKLRALKNNILYAVEAILSRYGYHDETGNKIITVIQSWMNSDLISLNDLIQIIDNSANAEFKIEPGYSSDAVLTQTIHSSKGLEYPVVIISNVNVKNFPGNKGDADKLIYNSVGGLRAKTFFTSNGRFYYRFNNWRSDLVNTVCKISDYDEERRLLYVAVTRAKQYVYFTAFNPSPFFKELSSKTGREIITDFDHKIIPFQAANEFSSVEIKLGSQPEKVKRFFSTHAIMDEIVSDEDSAQIDAKSYSIKTSKSKLDFGSKVHNIAHRLASGLEVESDLIEVQRLKKFITDLKTNELRSEVDFLYPKDDIVIRGIIDLIAFYDERIE
ncbi:MAG: UvrD-helicase domain-containing protein, partial [Bacteroidota bacterium]|nr:UvrD-helicase domain-containing protein [Bacteroidota bacterium]